MDEIWKPISWTVGLYEVSNLGRVRSLDRPVAHRGSGFIIKKSRIMKLHKARKTGYIRVSLRVNGKYYAVAVHRLVAAAFCTGNCPTKEVNHKDFNKCNNIFTNLEYVSHKENLEHAIAGGLYKGRQNRRNPRKLDARAANFIRTARAEGETCTDLAFAFGVSRSMISKIVSKARWA